MVSSQPSFMPRFSAAMEGWRIQSWRRLTDSSWRFSISARMASRSPGCACAQRGIANVAAVAAAAAAAPCRKVRRSDGERVVRAPALLPASISAARFFACSFLLLPELDAFAMAASRSALSMEFETSQLPSYINAGDYTFRIHSAMMDVEDRRLG